MGIFTKLTKSQIKDILKRFDLPSFRDFKATGIGMGTVNTYYKIVLKPESETFYLKIDEVGDLKRLKNELAIFKKLGTNQHRLSFECPSPLPTKSGEFFFKRGKKFVLLFTEVKGRSRYQNVTTGDLNQIGKKLAEIHKLRIDASIKDHRFCLKNLKKTFRKISADLKNKHPDLHNNIKTELTSLSKSFPKTLKQSLIHADLFPENMMWQGKQLSGIIDYEAAGRGSPLFDIAIAIHANCRAGQKFNQNKVAALLRGYESIRPLTQKDWQLLPNFLILGCLRLLITRLKDFELPGANPKAENFKDYREYVQRLEFLKTYQLPVN